MSKNNKDQVQKNEVLSKLYIIETLTNLHVGSGSENIGAIDSLVQVDPVTKIPVIHGSSLKGAVREHFNNECVSKEWETNVFGNEAKEKNEAERKQGQVSFFASDLLFLPVRGSENPYYLATSPYVINEFIKQLDFHFKKASDVKQKLASVSKIEIRENEPQCEVGNAYLEDVRSKKLDVSIKDIKELFCIDADTKLALFSKNDFIDLCQNLPVIARNHLENGESQNLWYEQVVPRKSIFYTFLSYRNNNHKNVDTLVENLSKVQKVQIGANATIGYGLCKFKNVEVI